MSTYNGERYMRQQIDSILGQKDVFVRLLVRDDGSTDSTLSILDEYKAKGQLEFYQGENLGPALSFMHLLQNAPASDYYAFADQDDLWLPEKLSVAVNSLKGHKSEPALYFCQTQLTDENLKKKDLVKLHPYLTFGESLIYKYVSGCTMVFNSKLRCIMSNKQPAYIHMHDAWVYLIAQAVGAYIFFDSTPRMMYRQHGDNAVGLGQSFPYEWKQRLQRLLNGCNDRYKQAEELEKYYKDTMTKENRYLLRQFLHGKKDILSRFSLIFNKQLRCSNRTTQFLFWCNLILNKY